ncbi:MAG: 7-cyano-7-deazaguanine synthase [Candidatus Omnitrophota bacterium]
MKAIVLLSGGLDSTLAAYILKEQEIELIALNFSSPFCLCNKKGGCSHPAQSVCEKLAIKMMTLDKTKEMLQCVKKPKYGYGSNMNPCIDCRIVMLKKAKEYMQKSGASFIITGEVLGQRPMSQKRNTLLLIEKEADLEGFVLRPLSAKILEETIPEKKGWVDRKKLLTIVGRGRREQMKLAKEFAINDYPCPSGGCLLTDPNFCRRLKDLLKYSPDFNLNDIQLLKLGRHLRINKEYKLIVGRNEKENAALINLRQGADLLFSPDDGIAGPIGLGRGALNQQDKELSCQIIGRYCDKQNGSAIKICVDNNGNSQKELFEVTSIIQGEQLTHLII